MKIEKTVFIAYRRTNIYLARAIYQNLTLHGFDVFIDYISIDSGSFDRIIMSQIASRAHFLVLLSPYGVQRFNEPDDWLKREIEFAIKNRRNIVPLMIEEFDFRDSQQYFTGELAVLIKYNAIRVIPDYFEEVMNRLRERFLNKPIDAILHPLPPNLTKEANSDQPFLEINFTPQDLEKDENYKPNLKSKTIKRTQVFISYSHQDKIWLNKLRTILRPLERNHAVRIWADTEIEIGHKWREKIEDALVAAKVAVLLVSPNFLASDFINDEELPKILDASEKEGLIIVWIPISASLYNITFIGDYQSAHNPAEPLDTLSDAQQNQIFVKVANVILKELTES